MRHRRFKILLIVAGAVFLMASASAATAATQGTPAAPVNSTGCPAKVIPIKGPVLHPENGTPKCATVVVGSKQALAAAAPGATLCRNYAPFMFIAASGGWDCQTASGTQGNPGIGSLRSLVNSTLYRIWFHQTASGGGWADCLDADMSFLLTGTRDANPGNIQITVNPNPCGGPPPSGAIEECQDGFGIYPLAWTQDTGLSDTCYQQQVSYPTTGSNFVYLTNGTRYRVWLHQTASGGGWADCYTDNMAYLLVGTRDATPGNLQITTNSSAC
jgi:hypothetical protein